MDLAFWLEFEDTDGWIRRLGEKEYIVNARISLDELCEKLKIELPEGSYTTLAGLTLDRTHRIPEKGTVIKVGEISLVVYRSSEQAVLEVRIHW